MKAKLLITTSKSGKTKYYNVLLDGEMIAMRSKKSALLLIEKTNEFQQQLRNESEQPSSAATSKTAEEPSETDRVREYTPDGQDDKLLEIFRETERSITETKRRGAEAKRRGAEAKRRGAEAKRLGNIARTRARHHERRLNECLREVLGQLSELRGLEVAARQSQMGSSSDRIGTRSIEPTTIEVESSRSI